MAGSGQVAPQWVIDTHGMVHALTTTKNSVRANIITAIEAGEMLILKIVSEEIKKAYPQLWPAFKSIRKKKYLPVTVPVVHAATMLSEDYGASLMGSMPSGEHFEAVAAARMKGCVLVSAAKALAHCSHIVSQCQLPPGSVVAPDAV